MWMIRRILGWIFVAALVLIALRFWATYAYVSVSGGYADMVPDVRPETSYFVDVTQRDVTKLKQEKAIVQFRLRGVIDKDTTTRPLFGRIVAVPGDLIEIKSGILQVNGEEVTDHVLGKTADDPEYKSSTPYDFKKILVPKQRVFILSNKWSSSPKTLDSKNYGMISIEDVNGKKSDINVVSALIQIAILIALGLGYFLFERFIK